LQTCLARLLDSAAHNARQCCTQCSTVLHTMLDSADLSDEILEVGITFRVCRKGERLLLDGSEHVRYGVALEG